MRSEEVGRGGGGGEQQSETAKAQEKLRKAIQYFASANNIVNIFSDYLSTAPSFLVLYIILETKISICPLNILIYTTLAYLS